MTTESLIDSAAQWQQAHTIFKAATGREATNSWEVMCWFAENAPAQKPPSLCEQLFGKTFDLW